ncbi:unnamed protein product [Allacma fusca]|uniref:aralkylamine N-acetyltransferase n=1 Tax=Allacma fusca TaxID=39272 RepID=A0A8J2LBE4_9HEXA|nr:unnamed protein product [Allacma fusca]
MHTERQIMAEFVEGDWGEFAFKMIDQSMAPAVMQHLRKNFYLDEPLLKLIGLSELAASELDAVATRILEDNLSFAAIEKNTGKIAGVRVTGRPKKGHKASVNIQSREFQMVSKFLGSVEKQVDLFDTFGVEEYADLHFASIDKDFRGQGLASEMYNRAISLLKGLNFKLAKSSFTSPFTRKISTKLGFEQIAIKYFREIEDENGTYPYSHLPNDEFVSVRILRL